MLRVQWKKLHSKIDARHTEMQASVGGRNSGRVDRCVHVRADRWIMEGRWMHGYKRISRQMNEGMDAWIHGWMDRGMDK